MVAGKVGVVRIVGQTEVMIYRLASLIPEMVDWLETTLTAIVFRCLLLDNYSQILNRFSININSISYYMERY